MLKQKKNKQRTKRVFFWEIPGDVPGYRTQPDPFQGKRATPDSNYQLPPHLDTRNDDNSEQDTRGAEKTQYADDLPQSARPNKNGAGRDEFLEQSKPATDQNKNPVSNRQWRTPVILLLLLAPLLLYYFGYFAGKDSGQKFATPIVAKKIEAESVPLVKPAKVPKVFELILGKDSLTPQSKIRVINHIVVKGDTLWDIAEKYVKDPFRYPELAELSRIKNPDLIYPYDIVRIHIYE